MISLQIDDIGALLNQMLKGSLFDSFLLREAFISHAFSVSIDGSLNTGFFSGDEAEQLKLEGLSYVPFSRVRPLCLDLMKGNKKPSSFRFVFLMSPQNQKQAIENAGTSFRTEDITGLFLNLAYKNDILTYTTGISYRVFSLDKTLEQEWDRLAAAFLKNHRIPAHEQ